MVLVRHPEGDYSFVPGIAPYSCGVVADAGFEVVSVSFREPVPWRDGFDRIEAYLSTEERSKSALCAMSLRSPVPFTFAGFADFNGEYASILRQWGVFVDGVNPVARTNVAPALVAPPSPSLYGFAFTRPCDNGVPKTFIVAGAGELPEGVLNREGIVSRGELSDSGLATKTEFVLGLMEERLHKLGVTWALATKINVYTVHPVTQQLLQIVNPRIGPAGIHGVTWHYTRPPIEEIEFEMDTRGVRTEIMI